MDEHHAMCACPGPTRRGFLADAGMGFVGLALGAMLHRDGVVRANSIPGWGPPDGQPHFPPRAKRVIWLMMRGGVSHLESFDPKPELTKNAGKTINESAYKNTVFGSPFLRNVREQVANNIIDKTKVKIYPTQIGFKKGGQSGIEVSDWWPHVRGCVDDIAVIRSMYTTDNNHGAQMEFFTGRHLLDGCYPTIGAWVNYGLGALSDDLPQFISMGPALEHQCLGATDANYLGPENSGVTLKIDPADPLPFARPGVPLGANEAAMKADLLGRLNGLSALEYPNDPKLRARIKSYELAFRMQTAVPEVLRFQEENEATRRLYGLDQDVTRPFGQQMLAARRLAERGVRFIQVFHGDGAAGAWDAHSGLVANHSTLCAQVDKPIAGLITDLKQRGLLEDTVVVWATEFGRTPCAQGADGRDHHNYGFSIWMAGGGIRGGIVHGATDELGFHAVEHRHYVTDVHATVLHLLGLDSRRLEIPGRKRLEVDHGKRIQEILV
ncbi:Protein of unknown function [Singulisphaera sp. GP187]|uniref:DUF1501 domain-containing protein n=1 Tax=Singulisphaera sp. GP187 TaxID=1882752 RepID=UPI00092AC7F4|nr:DUF1501 domain-containing protein [Singulisphaera sp. GP187]SIO61588.1 Protein of unknown function [Singulisphaera sp. GP187]